MPADKHIETTIRALEDAGSPAVPREPEAGGFVVVEGTSLPEHIGKWGPMGYADGLRLALCLSLQVDALAQAGRLPLSIELEDVVVVHAGWFLLINTHLCASLGPSGDIESVIPPIARTDAAPGTLGGKNLAPELRGQISLPLLAPVGICSFSLGKAVARSMGLENSIAPLAQTRLFYFLQRCFARDPKERALIFM